MFTRQQYLNKECTYEQYYLEIADEAGYNPPAQLVKLCKSSKNEHYNDVPLATFDAYAKTCSAKVDEAFRARGDYPTIAGMVSLMKLTIRRKLTE